MKAILNSDLFDNTSFYYKKAGSEVEVIQDGLTRNTYDKYGEKTGEIDQVIVKYKWWEWTFLTRTEILYHECKIDKSRITIKA